MAERKIAGNDMFLFIDVHPPTVAPFNYNYDTMVCLTNKSLKRATAQIDASSQCGPDFLPGAQTVTVDFEGMIALDPDANRISTGYVHDIWADKRTIAWKLAKAVPEDGDIIYTGLGFVSDLTDTYGQADPSTFSGTIAVKGNVSRVIQGS